MSPIPPPDEELESFLAPAREIPPVSQAMRQRLGERLREGAVQAEPTGRGAAGERGWEGLRSLPRSWVGLGGMLLGIALGAAGARWIDGGKPAAPQAPAGAAETVAATDPPTKVVSPSASSERPETERRTLPPAPRPLPPPRQGSTEPNRLPPSPALRHPKDPERGPVSPRATRPSAKASQPAAAPPSGEPPSAGDDVEAERRIIDAARAAAARGHPVEALRTLQRHRAEFPQGQLSEERDAIRIRSLVALGRLEEARRDAEAFRTSYPDSLLWPALSAALDRARTAP